MQILKPVKQVSNYRPTNNLCDSIVRQLLSFSLPFFLFKLCLRFRPNFSSFSAKATLSLQVLDVNDNAPKFHNLFYSQDVWKSSKVNSPILRINATDADTGVNGLIQFVAISGNINNTFFFQSDGMVFLRKSLLETKVTMFNITIAAMDKGTPKQQSSRTAVVIIRVQGFRPHRPLFGKGSYSAVISESVPVNENIIEVKASVYQGKSRVNYWIRNSKQNLPFRVDPSIGCVRTTKKLDREKKNVYVLTIVASTGNDVSLYLINHLYVIVR